MNGFHGDLVGFDDGGLGMSTPEEGQSSEQGYSDPSSERMMDERSSVDLRRVKVRYILYLFSVSCTLAGVGWSYVRALLVRVVPHQPNHSEARFLWTFYSLTWHHFVYLSISCHLSIFLSDASNFCGWASDCDWGPLLRFTNSLTLFGRTVALQFARGSSTATRTKPDS